MAFPRLRDSQPHERSLNKEFASMHRGEYLIEEGLLLVRIMIPADRQSQPSQRAL
jgi:hypothetical protein